MAVRRVLGSRWSFVLDSLRKTSWSGLVQFRPISKFSALDRLVRFKPAITDDEETEEDFETILDEYNDEPDPRLRLGKSLLSLGRVYYKHIEPYPEWFVDKQWEITSHRTPSQIRRCLKTWMVKVDRNMLQKYKGKKLAWGDKLPTYNESKSATIYAYGPEETVSYSFYFMPSRYSITSRLFKELKLLAGTFQPKRIVDFGCGPATAAAAAYTVWPSTVSNYTGIDMSQSMLDAGKIMTKNIMPNSVFWDKISDVVKEAAAAAKSITSSPKNAGLSNERFDLAVLTYTLSEMPNDMTRRAAVQVLFELLDEGGYLVIIESGNPYGSHTVRTARQFVLDTFNHLDSNGVPNPKMATTVFPSTPKTNKPTGEDEDEGEGEGEKDRRGTHRTEPSTVPTMVLPPPPGYDHQDLGAFVISPCTHDKTCPLAPGTWCSFSQKVSERV